MRSAKPAHAHKSRHKNETSCTDCGLSNFCLAQGIPGKLLGALDELAQNKRLLERGDYLFRQDEVFRNLFVVRSGSIKGLTYSDSSHERIACFYLPGEILGFGAIGNNQYNLSAVALEPTEVCEISFAQLQLLAHEIPSLQQRLHTLMSNTLIHCRSILKTLHNRSADKKLAFFLLEIAERLEVRGHQDPSFDLSMTRREIGDFLGMELETVSRTFSNFHRDRLLDVDKQRITILDKERLVQLLDKPAAQPA